MPNIDYVIQRQLGKGSFGLVYLVKNTKDNILYVMKEVDVELGNTVKATTGEQPPPSNQVRSDAMKEVHMMAQMNHQNIIRYIECFETDGTKLQGSVHYITPDNRTNQDDTQKKLLYIIMEYADSGDLNERIKAQKRPFSEQQILDWIVQLCLAIKHLHDRKCIHRDIKAENIFLTNDNRVKLGDFGISKILPHTFACAITRIGTPYYLSPEICMNRPYNTASDMWSLGVCLYELCMLSHPFDSSSMDGLLKKIVKMPHRPIHPVYHSDLRNLCDALLQKQASKRPSIADVLRIPIIQREINKWMSKKQMEQEFLALSLNDFKTIQEHPDESSSASSSSARDKPSNRSNEAIGEPARPKVVKTTSASVSPAPENNTMKNWLKDADRLLKEQESKRKLQHNEQAPVTAVGASRRPR